MVLSLGNLGLLGAFVGGVLFVSTFTVSLGTVILVMLAETMPIFLIAIIGGIGALVGDMIIFYFIRSNSLVEEIKHTYEFLGGGRLTNLLKSPYFSWSLPVIGAIIIATPLPDELGVSLLGLSRLKTYEFIALSYILNSIGILVVVSSVSAII